MAIPIENSYVRLRVLSNEHVRHVHHCQIAYFMMSARNKMTSKLIDKIMSELSHFSSHTRLYALEFDEGADAPSDLLVEAFTADEQLQHWGKRDVIVLSTSAHLDAEAMLGKTARLEVSLADRSRTSFSGYVNEVAILGSEGGLARYRLRLVSWLWMLGQVRNSRVWEEKSVIEIIDEVFTAYAPQAQWKWSDELGPFMESANNRSYCCQYRETDLVFVSRLLTREGLAWRIEEHEGAHRAVIFADSRQTVAVPEDASSVAGNGIRYHGAHTTEKYDSIHALFICSKMTSTSVTMASYDYKTKGIVTANVASNLAGLRNSQELESYDFPGQYAFSNSEQSHRYALLHAEALEARAETWRMRSTVRTLRPGTRFTFTDAPRQTANGDYVVVRVVSVGVNNVPAAAKEGLAELFGPIPELLEERLAMDEFLHADLSRAIKEADERGYCNCFDALRADRPFRPMHTSDDRNAKPTTHHSQSAIVVGPDGSDRPNGADELYCDRLGRVRIRYHWQESTATCWVRVAQRSAGGGMGSQFLPRIGQEVLVKFLEGDIDRPIIVGALYNGQGEGGIAPTPGGQVDGDSGAASLFHPAHDHAVSAQGNIAGANSPVWHGTSADSAGHRNNAAQWGVRSKAFGGSGYNQLLFDDTDAQGRIQLKSSSAASELNMGHLIHAADNYRGSLRGQGVELRTDVYGSVRAGAGLLVTSYKIIHNATARDPAGDNAPGIALLKQAVKLGGAFSKTATTHETVALAAHLGAAKTGSSMLDEKAAPLQALLTAVSGMGDNGSLDAARADASERKTDSGDGKLPQTTDPIIAIAAQGGLGVTAGQSLQLANGETITLMSGQDTQFMTGGQMRVHSEQAIGVLAGAVKPGENNVGVQLIVAKDPIDIQAQTDVIKVQAREDVNVISANAHIDWAAAKSISLSTSGGANITIEGGNITVQCPGKITIHAGMKSFTGPTRMEHVPPVLPHPDNSWVEIDSYHDDEWNTPWPLTGMKFVVAGKPLAKAVPINSAF